MAGDIGVDEVAIVARPGQDVGDDIGALGIVTQRYGPRVVILAPSTEQADLLQQRTPHLVVIDARAEVPAETREGLNEAERLGFEAFSLRRSAEYSQRKAARPLAGESWDAGGATPPDDPNLPALDPADLATGGPTSSRLSGSVVVGLVIVSGPGGLAFSSDEQILITAEVQNGIGWLSTQYQETPVEFRYAIEPVVLTLPPPDPPPPDPEAYWLNPTLQALGYPPGRAGVLQYVNALRTALGTDWTYAAFFTKYPVNHFAYAYVGGPYLVMQWPNDGWGPDNIDRVFAHETGHIFNAPDEYASSNCNCGGAWGVFHVPNENCANCAPGGGSACIMKSNDWTMCSWTPRHLGTPQWNVQGNKVLGSPFATGGVVYFRGNDNRLWRVNAQDGSNQQQINGNYTASSPFVSNGVVYFQGTDSVLWRVDIDGSNQQQINGNATASSPFVAGGVAYFQGTDDRLWRVNIDGSNQQQINNNATASTPFVADGIVYFQGTDNKLWRVDIDGSNQQQINNNATVSTPFVAGGVVYFQGTDNRLWRVNIDGSNQQQINGNYTASSPFVANGVVYFRGTDNKLWRVDIDGSNQQSMGGNTLASSPFVADGGLYFQGTDDELWLIDL